MIDVNEARAIYTSANPTDNIIGCEEVEGYGFSFLVATIPLDDSETIVTYEGELKKICCHPVFGDKSFLEAKRKTIF